MFEHFGRASNFFPLKFLQAYGPLATAPIARHGLKYTIARRPTGQALTVHRQVPRRDLIPVAPDERSITYAAAGGPERMKIIRDALFKGTA